MTITPDAGRLHPQRMITPYHSIEDFRDPLTIDDKITIVKEQTLGWVLDIADVMLNAQLPQMQHAGWAAMMIAFSYFEMIAKLKDGYTGIGKSEKYFWEGVLDVFPALREFDEDQRGDIRAILYGSVRCGFYHAGMCQDRVVIWGDLPAALSYEPHLRVVGINPHLLVPLMKHHFSGYITELEDSTNSELREKFERRYDFLLKSDPLSK